MHHLASWTSQFYWFIGDFTVLSSRSSSSCQSILQCFPILTTAVRIALSEPYVLTWSRKAHTYTKQIHNPLVSIFPPRVYLIAISVVFGQQCTQRKMSTVLQPQQSRNTRTVMSAEVFPRTDMQKIRTLDKNSIKAFWNKQTYSFQF